MPLPLESLAPKKSDMSRRFVNELADGESINQVFLASEKQLRTNRNGNLYLQVRISDRSGSLTAMLWNAQQRHLDSFENGDFVTVRGTSQVYNGTMQVLAKEVEKADSSGVEESDFVTFSLEKLETLLARLGEILRGLDNVHLRNLAECFLVDEEFMAALQQAPAGVKNHHAFRGGLLDHTLSLMETALLVAPRYTNLDKDLLVFGAFLHDLGKSRELTYSPDLGYSDQGQLIGHMVQGVVMLEEMIQQTNKQSDDVFPVELADQLRHMIVSHHGTQEFGSPKVPMTLEAVALHYLDSLDAKLHSFQQLIDEDVNTASPWTVYHPSIGRKIYKGESA